VLLAVATVILAGRFLVQPVLRAVARTRLRELFTAAALLLIIGTADRIDEENAVIIAGFGRFGNIVGRLLRANGVGTSPRRRRRTPVGTPSRFARTSGRAPPLLRTTTCDRLSGRCHGWPRV
jgi:hypothetical protein